MEKQNVRLEPEKYMDVSRGDPLIVENMEPRAGGSSWPNQKMRSGFLTYQQR